MLVPFDLGSFYPAGDLNTVHWFDSVNRLWFITGMYGLALTGSHRFLRHMAVGVHDMSRFIQLVTILCDFAWYHNFDKAYCKKGPTGCGKNNLSLTMNIIKQSI